MIFKGNEVSIDEIIQRLIYQPLDPDERIAKEEIELLATETPEDIAHAFVILLRDKSTVDLI